jgi:hypothetical protein
MFVSPSKVADKDLRTLVGMRDGTVHAAENAEVEERLVVAFVQQADEFLDDLGRDRAVFWGPHLAVVDALLADASDKLAYRVQLKLAAAHANFELRYGGQPAEILELVRRLAKPQVLDNQEERAPCPSCESPAVAIGYHDVEWDYERDKDGGIVRPVAVAAWFIADVFVCGVCGLEVGTAAELDAAGMPSR